MEQARVPTLVSWDQTFSVTQFGYVKFLSSKEYSKILRPYPNPGQFILYAIPHLCAIKKQSDLIPMLKFLDDPELRNAFRKNVISDHLFDIPGDYGAVAKCIFKIKELYKNGRRPELDEIHQFFVKESICAGRYYLQRIVSFSEETNDMITCANMAIQSGYSIQTNFPRSNFILGNCIDLPQNINLFSHWDIDSMLTKYALIANSVFSLLNISVKDFPMNDGFQIEARVLHASQKIQYPDVKSDECKVKPSDYNIDFKNHRDPIKAKNLGKMVCKYLFWESLRQAVYNLNHDLDVQHYVTMRLKFTWYVKAVAASFLNKLSDTDSSLFQNTVKTVDWIRGNVFVPLDMGDVCPVQHDCYMLNKVGDRASITYHSQGRFAFDGPTLRLTYWLGDCNDITHKMGPLEKNFSMIYPDDMPSLRVCIPKVDLVEAKKITTINLPLPQRLSDLFEKDVLSDLSSSPRYLLNSEYYIGVFHWDKEHLHVNYIVPDVSLDGLFEIDVNETFSINPIDVLPDDKYQLAFDCIKSFKYILYDMIMMRIRHVQKLYAPERKVIFASKKLLLVSPYIESITRAFNIISLGLCDMQILYGDGPNKIPEMTTQFMLKMTETDITALMYRLSIFSHSSRDRDDREVDGRPDLVEENMDAGPS